MSNNFSMDKTGHKLVQDDDCHWYIIPIEKEQEWNTWLSDDGGLTTDTPEFAEQINSPSDLVLIEWNDNKLEDERL